MRTLFLLFLLLGGSLAHADTLAELRRLLATLDGVDPISAKLGFTHSQSRKDDTTDDRKPATVGADVGADAQGVRMSFARRTLDTAIAEARQTDPEARRPVSGALAEVRVTDVDEYLSAAPKLLATLERARVLEDKAGTWHGQPARVLRLKLDPPLSKRDRKYVKKLDASARIWLAANGVPLAAEQDFVLSGRALLVVNFESSTKESFEFQRRGDRLVVVRHRRADTSSGGGESGTRRIDVRLTLAPQTSQAPVDSR